MANGQAVLTSTVLDTAEVDRLCTEIEEGERSRHAAHADQLERVLELDRVYAAAGLDLQTPAVLALLRNSSESSAGHFLYQAKTLHAVGAIAVMRKGFLTVEQARVVVDVLGPVADDAIALRVWERLRARLEQDSRYGAVLPPARLAELLRRWLIEADPKGAAARRDEAERDGADVDLWRRDDGLTDIAIRAVSGPNAQACAQRIQEHAEPIGPYDERPVGMRCRDAAVDLILGRTTLPFRRDPVEAAEALEVSSPFGATGCRCGQGASVPCGANVQILVPLKSALGTADAPAELVGHGPVDADLLDQLLHADPVLTRVWVDAETGVPVAIDDRTWEPGRDPLALRAALLDIASGDPPAGRVPMHPDDHPPPDDPSPPRGSTSRHAPPYDDEGVLAEAALGRPVVLDHPHPTNTPGAYVVPRRLRRLLLVRSPRCEWPGCGRRAVTSMAGCDIDHDLAWPAGPTCGCNLGPLCRRHHRIKQLGWTKERRAGGHVRWLSQTGRRFLSRSQHQVPPVALRAIPPLAQPHPLDGLSSLQLVEALWHSDPADPIFDSYPVDRMPEDVEPPYGDAVGERYARGDLWARLSDRTARHEPPPPTDADEG